MKKSRGGDKNCRSKKEKQQYDDHRICMIVQMIDP